MKRILLATVLSFALATSWMMASNTNYHLSLLQAPISSLEPIHAADTNTQMVVNNAFDGLVGWDFGKGIYPQLASSWSISDDRMVYRFRIRRGAVFHDGKPVTAHDIAASLNHLINTPSYFRDHYRRIRHVSAVESTVELRLHQAYPDILLLLSGVGAKIVRRNGGSVVGSGPFVPELTKAGVVLRRFPSYWGPLPPTDEIRFEYLPEDEAIARATRNEIDDLSLIALSGTELPPGHGKWLVQPMWATWAIGMDQRVPPFNRDDVRAEMVARLRSSEFVRQLYPDQEEAFGLVPFGVRGFVEPSKRPPSVALAAKRPVTRVDVLIPSFLIKVEAISQWIRNAFKGSWLQVNPVPTPFEWMIANYAQGKMGAFLLSINSEFPDPSFVLRSLGSESSSNFLGLQDPAIDKAILEIDTQESGQRKNELAQRVNEHLLEQNASVNLMHVRHRVWTRDCVTGLRTNPVSEGYVNYRELRNRCH